MSINADFSINCDCVVSLGPTCRAAEALRRAGLRMFSSPFDWLLNYSLDNFFNFLTTNGLNFFKNIKKVPEYDREVTYGVIDIPTGIISMHDFFKNVPFEVAHKNVLNKMNKRFKRLSKIMKKANNICFVSNRETNPEDFFKLAEELTKKYKFSNVYFVNIKNSEQENINVYNDNNATVYEISFSDIHKDGDDMQTNPYFWKGNTDLWDDVLSHIKLSNYINYDKHVEINLGFFKINFKNFLLR